MFAAALSLMADVPMAIQASGMEPQLRIIREAAAERNWPVTCAGHMGEEGVVRFGVPAGTSIKSVDGFIQIVKSVASSYGNLDADAAKNRCDAEPIHVEGRWELRDLLFTAGERDPRILALAHECGFSKAHWRATLPEDAARFGRKVDPQHSTTLDAGENVIMRYGPGLCFLKMHQLLLSTPATK